MRRDKAITLWVGETSQIESKVKGTKYPSLLVFCVRNGGSRVRVFRRPFSVSPCVLDRTSVSRLISRTHPTSGYPRVEPLFHRGGTRSVNRVVHFNVHVKSGIGVREYDTTRHLGLEETPGTLRR